MSKRSNLFHSPLSVTLPPAVSAGRLPLRPLGLVAGLIMLVLPSLAGMAPRAQEMEPVPLAAEYATPPTNVQAKFRWWWPHGLVDPEQIAREIDAMADAGFGGAEIADVHHSVSEPLDPAGHGWGTSRWVEAVEAALRQAQSRGMRLDLTVGPSWPAALPTITPDSPAAATELATGQAILSPGETYHGPVPPPDVRPASGSTERELLRVQAIRISEENEEGADEMTLVGDSLIDLTDDVEDSQLNWTAPRDGSWILIAYWQRGSGQRPERGPHTHPISYVVDHFSREGAQAIIDFWETEILSDAMRELLAEAGGAFFEDSIEMETDVTNWTPGLLEEFEQRTGYSLLPYLPLVVEKDEDPIYRFENDIASHVAHDWWTVMGDLFLENHLQVLQDWAHGLGMQMRAQPYGMPTDAITAAAHLDMAEGESLGFKNLDDYRSLAGGRDMGGHRVLSNEAGAFAGGAYSTTWQRILKTLNPQFAAGVNQTVLHGFSYAIVPDVKWPGFAAFTPYGGYPGYAESWGPRMPSWRHAPDVADYFARTHFVLQRGVPKVDVAFLRQKGYAGSGFGAAWFSDEGVPRGWTHTFVSPPLLDLPLADVSDGHLAPHGPAFQVLVFEGDPFQGRKPTLEVATAERLLGFARAGLPIIAVGDWSQPQSSGLPQGDEEARLQELLADLLEEPTVANVPDRESIPDGLAQLRLAPRVEHDPSPLVHAHRVANGADFYYFSNTSEEEAVETNVWFTRTNDEYVPYRLDAWSGEIERVALYKEEEDRLETRVSVAPGASAVIAIGPLSWGEETSEETDEATEVVLHATDSEADAVQYRDGELYVRAHEAGNYTTQLSNGRSVETVFESVPGVTTLDDWELTVEDWRPGASATETEKVTHELTMDELVPWTEVPELEDVSGIGTYRTTVNLSDDWKEEHGAILELGSTFDTVRVRINGKALTAIDPLNPVVDAGQLLRAGDNTIEIEVTTTLNNRLRVSDPDVYSVNERQPYGLLGPVRIVPYGEKAL